MYDECIMNVREKGENVCDSCYVIFVVFGDQQSYCIGLKTELN